ncbi:MAG: PQQ-dependent sugar dehydrogenase [Limisphaerales bacterium]
MNPIRFSIAVLFFAVCADAQIRKPWTTSRISGSPEPPKPYIAERVFSNLPIRQGLEMVALDGQLLVMTRDGKIWSFNERDTEPTLNEFADLKAINANTRSAYGLAFHPRWRENKQVFIAYIVSGDPEAGTRLSRFRFKTKPLRILPDSEELILTWRSGGHNGANLQFGPDEMLFVSTGDATPPNPPDGLNTGQDNSDLLSAVLRIDVGGKSEGKAYRIPKDNPYVGRENVRPEIWAFGFRNPWKMSFDSRGRLWVGDVGWELWEMIHLVKKGSNHGWSAMEASNPIRPETASPLAPITPPAAAHPHTEAASMTGGYEYTGSRLPKLKGAYIYGDYETGKIWSLRHDGSQVTEHIEIADTPHRISTFGVGNNNELYYINYTTESEIYRLIPNPRVGKASNFPRKLSESGLFADTGKLQPNDGVYAFSVHEPMWQDGANSIRHVALPGKTSIHTEIDYRRNQGTTTWPEDAVLAKTISLGRKPVETQVLHYDGETWNGYSYRWNKAGTDADLVPAEGDEFEVNSRTWKGGNRYRISSRAECMRCHNMWNEFTPAFEPMQLSGFGGITNQAVSDIAVELGLANTDFFHQNRSGQLQTSRRGGSIERRARSWLHANCAHCHRRHGGGTAPLEVNYERELSESFTLWQKPTRGDFGLTNPSVIVPGDPSRSILNYRVSSIGAGHMPPIGPREVDVNGARLLWQWVKGFPSNSEIPESTGLSDTSSAMRMAHAIDSGNLKKSDASLGLASPNHNVRALFERFRPPSERHRHTMDPRQILALTGNAKAGAKLLTPTGKLATCLACHQLNDTGRNLGPNFAGVGTRLNRAQLLESITQPSKTVAPEYRIWNVETKDGEYHTGFITTRSRKSIHLKLATGQSAKIATERIKSNKPQTISLMPEGMLQMMTEQEAADLLAFLSSLRQ